MRTRLGVVTVTTAALFLAPIAFSQQLQDPSQDAPTAALGTAFTYQGQLLDGGTPATGSYDLQLRLFNAASGGAQVGSPVVKSSVPVTGGLFTVELDFGTSAFTAQALWLDIGVRPGGTSGSFTILSPRQPLNPAPFAHYSKAGVATDVQCSGCVGSDDLAAGAVGVSQLAGGGATSGQVLTATSPSGMAWQSPAGVTGSGSTGQVAFWSGATTLSGSTNFYWDNANGRLGLGTAAPSEQLTLTGNLALPATSMTAGQVTLGTALFMHASGADSTFLGAQAGNLWTTGTGNTALGSGALEANSTANHNTAVGTRALYTQSFSNGNVSYDSDNTALGYEALNKAQPGLASHFIVGLANTAVGAFAMHENTQGDDNTAVGAGSLQSNLTADYNTAVGCRSLYSNTYGTANSALGDDTLGLNTLGEGNVAVGSSSLGANSTASNNTAVGTKALDSQSFSNSDARWYSYNTAVGYGALFLNEPTSTDNGIHNTAVGASSMVANQTGLDNTAVGYSSLSSNQTGFSNTAVGMSAASSNDSGSWNVAIGVEALKDNVSGTGNIAIGHLSGAGFTGSDQLFIGNGLGTLIWGDISSKHVAIGMTGSAYQLQLALDSAGKPNGGSWANSSDARLKRDIAPLSGAVGKLLRLQGVSFEWVNPGEHGGRAESAGFIAQDVERVFPAWVSFIDPSGADRALVAPGEKVRSLTLPFEFDAYLVEAIREQQKEIEAKARRIDQQDALIAELLQRVQALEETVRQQKRP